MLSYQIKQVGIKMVKVVSTEWMAQLSSWMDIKEALVKAYSGI